MIPDNPTSRCPRIERALNYPYQWPADCYLFHGGRAHPVTRRDPHREQRVPVLAYGSNRSPEQLGRKFGDLATSDAILVERCEVRGWDVVHSAHVTRYGAVPAALHQQDEVTIQVAITWLNREQVRTMDLSEQAGRNYGRSPIGGSARLGDGDNCDTVQAYLTSHGPLTVSNEIVSHAAIDAHGRPRTALHNVEVLRRAHRAFGDELTFELFVIRLVEDSDYRERITDRLKQGL